MRLFLLILLVSCATAPKRPAPKYLILDHQWFTVHYDQNLRLARFVEYTLTRESLAHKLGKRKDHFRPDPQLVARKIPFATPEEYKHTGFDRGHLAPAADFSFSQKANDETFVMSNMAPQTKKLNRGAWLELEQSVRRWACGEGKIRVITGPVLAKSDPRLPSGLPIPQRFFKIVVDETPPRKTRAYLHSQTDPRKSSEERRVSVKEIESVTGLSFPGLPKEAGVWKAEDCQPKSFR